MCTAILPLCFKTVPPEFMEPSVIYAATISALAVANALVALFRHCAEQKREALDADERLRVARIVARSGVILVCGGEAPRDEEGARLAMHLPRGGVAFFSSGHYKHALDFDSSAPENPHRELFARAWTDPK